MKVRPILYTLLGAATIIGSAEAMMRKLDGEVPSLDHWPTIETEVKSDQLAQLPAAPSLLIIGSSTTESAVDPHRLIEMGAAPSVFNSAFPFFSPAAAEVWLNDFVQPWKEVDTLLIGIRALPPPSDPGHDPLTTSLLALGSEERETSGLGRFALWRMRGLVSDLDEALRRERTVASGLWTDLGHQTFYYGQSGGSFHGEQSYGRPAMDEVQASALRRLIERTKASGATPVLVIEPGRYPDSVESTTITEYLAWLSDFATELDVELWDTYSMDWDPAMFADDAHLNEIGAESYTEYIGQLLVELADPTRAVSAQSASTSPAARIASARAAASPGRTEMVSTPPPP